MLYCLMRINKNLISNKINNYIRLKKPKLYRPTSKPFISGDTFRNYSDHIFDESQTLKPSKVKKNDIVFLKTDLKKIYFENYHPEIKNPYYLISHNSDESVDKTDIKFIDSKIKHWFAMKLNTQANDKVSPLPAGLENARYRNNGKVKNFKKIIDNNDYLLSNKTKRILCSFNPNTNYQVRKPLLDISKKHPDIDIANFDNQFKYLENLSTYKFNLCPEGNNFESHRIWESLLFGCTPIVLNNIVNQNFFNLGVPLLILNSWDELKSYTCLDLEKLNKINFNKNYDQFVRFDYWKKYINSKSKN